MWGHKFCVSLGFRMCFEICQATWKQQLQCWGTERLSWKLGNIPAPLSSFLMTSREGLHLQNKRPWFICCGRKYGKYLSSDCHLALVVLPTKRLQVQEKRKGWCFLILPIFCPIFLSLFFGIAFILIVSLMSKPEFQLLLLCFLSVLLCVAMGTVHIHSETWSKWFFETK